MRKAIHFLAFLLFMAPSPGSSAQEHGPIPPIQEGFGANGPFSVAVETFPSPLWRRRDVYLFHPAEGVAPSPVVFFSHGFGATNSSLYMTLITHIVSRGYSAVYSPYRTIANDPMHQGRYNTLFAGFEEAVKRFPQFLDSSRVGFMGHSFGAGATPAMAWRGLVDNGWGEAGAFLFIMAPWYAYQITQRQLEAFPSHTKLIVQVYDDDGINDQRMAKDIFENINIPNSEKDFITLFSDSFFDFRLQADHLAPEGPQAPLGEEDALDYYGIYRLVDALAEYAFDGHLSAKDVALGNGNAEQAFMGRWPNGQPVSPLEATDDPVIMHPQGFYTFPWDNDRNPRKNRGGHTMWRLKQVSR